MSSRPARSFNQKEIFLAFQRARAHSFPSYYTNETAKSSQKKERKKERKKSISLHFIPHAGNGGGLFNWRKGSSSSITSRWSLAWPHQNEPNRRAAGDSLLFSTIIKNGRDNDDDDVDENKKWKNKSQSFLDSLSLSNRNECVSLCRRKSFLGARRVRRWRTIVEIKGVNLYLKRSAPFICSTVSESARAQATPPTRPIGLVFFFSFSYFDPPGGNKNAVASHRRRCHSYLIGWDEQSYIHKEKYIHLLGGAGPKKKGSSQKSGRRVIIYWRNTTKLFYNR